MVKTNIIMQKSSFPNNLLKLVQTMFMFLFILDMFTIFLMFEI